AIGTTNLNAWSDTVSFASDPEGKDIVLTLGNFNHAGALAVDASYTRSASVAVPITLSGTFYPVVKSSGPFEFIHAGNNTAVGGPVVVTLTPAPDFTPIHGAFTTPGSTAELTSAAAGAKVDVSWTVNNVGQGDGTGIWYDKLTLREVGGS